MTLVLDSPRGSPAPPPSRDANPFATCWTRPGALPWIDTDQQPLAAMVERLTDANWRGQIVGRHGVGKSTLMQALRKPLAEAGRKVVMIDAARGAEGAEADRLGSGTAGSLLLVEGFERLGRRERRGWLAQTRRSGVGLLVTTHRSLHAWRSPLAVVARVEPDERLLGSLFERLTADRSTPVTFGDAITSFSHRRGNVRDVWFDLYDLHEQRTRQHRTTPWAGP